MNMQALGDRWRARHARMLAWLHFVGVVAIWARRPRTATDLTSDEHGLLKIARLTREMNLKRDMSLFLLDHQWTFSSVGK